MEKQTYNRKIFIKTYTQAFVDANPNFSINANSPLLEKWINDALSDIRKVSIAGDAFKITCERLRIKHTYKAIEKYISA